MLSPLTHIDDCFYAITCVVSRFAFSSIELEVDTGTRDYFVFIPQTRDSMTIRRKSSSTADVELSVSRINRLLRPLRNKCAILASATSRPSGSAVPITYGSNPSLSLEIRAPPPLDVLHDPKLVISHAHQESRSLDTLARQIYAVTNTYRNVVQAALSGRVVGML